MCQQRWYSLSTLSHELISLRSGTSNKCLNLQNVYTFTGVINGEIKRHKLEHQEIESQNDRKTDRHRITDKQIDGCTDSVMDRCNKKTYPVLEKMYKYDSSF